MLTLITAALLTSPTARAAELTDIAPMLRGDVEVRQDSDIEAFRLLEDGEVVARNQSIVHDLVIGVDFSFAPGAAFFVDVPVYLAERVAWSEARQMIFDPNDDSGTMIGGSDIAIDPYQKPGASGSGLGGVWLGLHGTPFNQDFARSDQSTLMLELAWRTPDKSSFWTYGDNGSRGAGPGASALRLHVAGSTTKRWAEPYVYATFVNTGRQTTDVLDESGVVVVTQLEIDPASTFEGGAGVEAVVWKNDETGGKATLDFRGIIGYRSWQDIPSGIYLPNVLDASRTVAVTQSDATWLEARMGVNYRIMAYVQLGAEGSVGTTSPFRVEHPYDITTGIGSLGWGVHSYLRFRARDPLFD